MENKDNLKIAVNTDNIVEFMYDTPKQGTNNYGAWFLYGLRQGDKEVGLFATETLHKKLQFYGIGDKVNIRKEEIDNGRVAWNVIPEEGTTAKYNGSPNLAPPKMDNRTHDIHKQVCLKLAVDNMEKSGKCYTSGELVVIEANMYALLDVLEGSAGSQEKEEVPF